jgi:hypothetical protein
MSKQTIPNNHLMTRVNNSIGTRSNVINFGLNDMVANTYHRQYPSQLTSIDNSQRNTRNKLVPKFKWMDSSPNRPKMNISKYMVDKDQLMNGTAYPGSNNNSSNIFPLNIHLNMNQ